MIVLVIAAKNIKSVAESSSDEKIKKNLFSVPPDLFLGFAKG